MNTQTINYIYIFNPLNDDRVTSLESNKLRQLLTSKSLHCDGVIVDNALAPNPRHHLASLLKEAWDHQNIASISVISIYDLAMDYTSLEDILCNLKGFNIRLIAHAENIDTHTNWSNHYLNDLLLYLSLHRKLNLLPYPSPRSLSSHI